ncbi:MAG: hypothetical protein M3P52_03740 [Actinomycetota bacterium]|nr:hypothetical protein [Actinomycetota bacterium]
MNVQSLRRASGVIVGSDFSDPTNERLIYLSAAGLVLVGVALLVGTLMWWRRGRQEHPVLSPLEVMGGRAWAKTTEGDRRRRLDHVRLAGAGAAASESARAEPVDLQALVRSVPQAFDDLREPGEVVEPSVVADSDEGAVEVVDDAEPSVVTESDEGAVEVVDDAEPSAIAEPVEVEDELPAAGGAADGAESDATSTSAEQPVVDRTKVVAGQKSPTAKDEAEAIDTLASAPIDPL